MLRYSKLKTLSDPEKKCKVVSGKECRARWGSLFINNMRGKMNLSGTDGWWGKEAGSLGTYWIWIGQFLSCELRMEGGMM